MTAHACWKNSDKVLKLMFDKESIYKFDFNAQNKYGYTGFILACKHKTEKAVDLILANYQHHQIDLKLKDKYGQSGMDIWPDKFQGMNI